MARGVNQLGKALISGAVTEKELRAEYSRLRSIAQKRVARTQKSDIPYLPGNVPYFTKLRNITTTQELVRELSQLERFIESPRSTRAGRVAIREKTLATLSAHGIEVNKSDYNKWVAFMEWFKNSEYAAKYDSNSDEVMEIFEEGASARQWERMFKEYTE